MPIGLHQNWNSIAPAQSQGPVPQPVIQDRRPMENFQSQGPVIPQVYQDRMNAVPGPNINPAYLRAFPNGQPPLEISAPRYPLGMDGTGGPTLQQGQQYFLQDMMTRMAEGQARRQAAALQLQGLFGGGQAGGSQGQTPFPIQYPQPSMTGQQNAFDDLSRWLMQRQLNPVPNMRAYRGSSFGGGQDWQNQFKDF